MKTWFGRLAVLAGVAVGVVAPTDDCARVELARRIGFLANVARPDPGPGPRPGGGLRTVVSVGSGGPYGQVLVVGGAGAGSVPAAGGSPASPLYPAGSSLVFRKHRPVGPGPGSSRSVPCRLHRLHGLDRPGLLSCTGSEADPEADWPALTTTGPPVAGPGVNPFLLGEVYRSDLGTFQVTYAGHLLYLFDPGPASYSGSEFLETVAPLPPWHTAWYLISPAGLPAVGGAHLETEAPGSGTTYTTSALGTVMLPAFGGVTVTVYDFSTDSPWRSSCNEACARDFVPVYTSSAPTSGSGVTAGRVGVIVRSDGSHQVTYHGHPLYIYSQEEPLLGPGGPETTGTAGNGAGIRAFGGVFSVVSP